MGSKFTSIVRVKKQALQKAELNLVRARNSLTRLSHDLDEARKEAANITIPKSGNASVLSQSMQFFRVLNQNINQIKENIELRQKEIVHFTNLYKNANIEHEKVKYLEQEDIKMQLKQKKRVEEHALDEFATMKFARDKNA
ncbi:MAG: flagellar export protein FliJ [Campylobacter sp.]|nr:flagellar export protein FliJ [Campylobacter sp.]